VIGCGTYSEAALMQTWYWNHGMMLFWYATEKSWQAEAVPTILRRKKKVMSGVR
jgi:hypothetical protein